MVFKFNMAETLAIAIVLLLLGSFIKGKVAVLRKYFIPTPVIGGVLFALLLLVGHNTGAFTFQFDMVLKDFCMVIFFATIGFLASLEQLKKGGVGVALFLLAAIVLVIIQNIAGISLAKVFGLHPYIGLAAGSVPLTGGHGTAGAFGPLLEEAGAVGAFTVAIASATFGLVSGCMVGGPVAKKLMDKHDLKSKDKDFSTEDGADKNVEHMTEETLFKAIVVIAIAMGIGASIPVLFKKYLDFTIPGYLGPMVVAAVIRNIMDSSKNKIHLHEISVIGNISLSLFLAMALMSMKLWELAALALPLVVILLVQTVIMVIFAYFVTFNIMGRDYDAATMATGHCGFGMGATPNAIANMAAFTEVNGPSLKAFFVIPLVGSLFIDFFNAIIITTFMNFFG